MKRILIAGNSQAGVLKDAFDKFGSPEGTEISFYVTPGGSGPYFDVVDDRLVPIERQGGAAPRFFPAHVPDTRLSQFDAVVVSALGFIDSGTVGEVPLAKRGRLFEFDPMDNDAPFLSRGCYAKVIEGLLLEHHGFQFLRTLSKNYSGQIIVQPMPHLADDIASRPEWGLAKRYRRPAGMYEFVTSVKDGVLAEETAAAGATLLPYVGTASGVYTHKEYMGADGAHPNVKYGNFVMQQIATTATA